MRRYVLIALLIMLFCSGALLAQTFGAVLTGSQEAPSPCPTAGFGNATVSFDAARQNINVTVNVANLGSPITLSHIHEGAAGVAGPVVIGFVPPNSFTNGTMTGTFAVPDAALVQRILTNPGNFYVNVHTAQCPGGAVRGQLAEISGGPITYAAMLRPQNEVPPVTSNAFGSALVTIDPVAGTIAWEVNSNGIASPTLSHIHRGPAGVAGPVIINFATSAAQIPNGRTNGSNTIANQQTAAFTAADLTALSSPSTANGYYVNVHSQAFPGGEIRGQLVPANELDLVAAGHVPGVGGTFVTDARIFNPSFDTPATALIEFLPGSAAANTNASTSMVVNIAPRGTAALDDVAGASGLNASGLGGLRVSSALPILASSRIFQNNGNGTIGQFVPAFKRSAALRRGVLTQLSNRPPSVLNAFRTNIGFFNPNPTTVTARVEVRDAAGAVIGSNTVTLPPLSEQLQGIGVFFPGVDLSNSPTLSLSFDASAPIFVVGSVLDNTSQDSILIEPQEDPSQAANQT